MATGGELDQSINRSSEMDYAFSCKPCGSDGKHIEALFHCVECVENFCSACLHNHNRYSMMKTHKILETTEMVTQEPQAVYALPTEKCTEKCPDHHGNLIELYCPEHNDVCCHTCVSIDHRSCEGITYIPKAAKNITESKEYTDITPSMQTIQGRLETMKITMDDDLKKLYKEKEDALKQIADFRKFIDRELDRIQEIVTDDFQIRHKNIEKDIKSNIKSLGVLISTLEASLQKLAQMKTDNESEIFVQLKLGEKGKLHVASLLNKMEVDSVRGTLKFIKNEELNDFMTNIDTIGRITIESDSSSGPQTDNKSDDKDQKTPQEQQAKPSVKSDDKDQKTPLVKQATLSSVADSATLCGEYSVKLSDDKTFCDIFDCCQLQDGTYIISDHNNDKLKRLNSSFKVIDSCKMNSRPCGVCVAGKMEVAVALDTEEKVQFMSIGDKIQLTRSFPTGIPCGMACEYSNDCLLVSSQSKIAMFNKEGQLLKEIKQKSPFTLLQYSCVIVNKNNTKVYVTNLANKVLVLDRKGEQIATIRDPELKGATKMCVLDNDELLVCCNNSNKVIHFNSDGRKLGVLLKKEDGLSKPIAICWDRINSRLIVTKDCSDKIRVYNLRRQ